MKAFKMFTCLCIGTSVFAVAKFNSENKLLTGRMTETPLNEADVVSVHPENSNSIKSDSEMLLAWNEASLDLTSQTDQTQATSVAYQELQSDKPQPIDALNQYPDVRNQKYGQVVPQDHPAAETMPRTDQRMLQSNTCSATLSVPSGSPFDVVKLTDTSGQLISLPNFSNSDCLFHFALVGADPAIFSLAQPGFALLYPFSVLSDGQILIANVSAVNAGVHNFTLRVTSDAVTQVDSIWTYDIPVSITLRAPCVETWTLPAAGAYDAIYQAPVTQILNMNDLSNGQCSFSVTLTQTGGPPSGTIFSVTQPVFTTADGPFPYPVDLTAPAVFSIGSILDINADNYSFDLTVTWGSGATSVFPISITLEKKPCTGLLNVSTQWTSPRTTLIKGSEKLKLWADNQGCNFYTTLTMADSTPVDPTLFSVIPETLQQNPVTGNYQFVTKPSIQVVATDQLLDGTAYDFRLTVFSLAEPPDNAFVTFDFTLTLVSSYCTSNLVVPADYSINYTYNMFACYVGGTNPYMCLIYDIQSAISNGDCRFNVQLFDTATMGSPDSIFSVNQPQLAVIQANQVPAQPIDINWVYNSPVMCNDLKTANCFGLVNVVTTDLTLDTNVYDLTMRVCSERPPDNKCLDFKFLVTIQNPSCEYIAANSYWNWYYIRPEIVPNPFEISFSVKLQGSYQAISFEMFELLPGGSTIPIDQNIFKLSGNAASVEESPGIWHIQQDWLLTVETQDITTAKERKFKINTYCYNKFNELITRSAAFVVQLIDNPCAKSYNLHSHPLTFWNYTDYSFTYTAHTTPPIPAVAPNITNGYCLYEYELLNSDLTPANLTMWQVNQPTFVPHFDEIDYYRRMFDVTSFGSLTLVQLSNIQQGDHPMVLRVHSLKAPGWDPVYRDVPFTLHVLPWPCTPLLLAPSPALLPLYNYYIKNPAVPLNIPIQNVQNGDCLFSTSLNPPADGATFVLTLADVPADPIIDTKFTKMSDAFLTVNTSDISLHLSVVTYTLTIASMALGDLQPPLTYTFDVKFIDNPCDSPPVTLSGPADNFYDKTVQQWVLGTSLLTNINNGNCQYSLELWDVTSGTPQVPPVEFTLVQPVHVPLSGASDLRICSVQTKGSLSIYSGGTIMGTYSLQLVVKSQKSILDTASLTINFAVTIIDYICIPGIILPSLTTPYTYYIKTPVVPMTIDFLGLSNTECKFTTSLTYTNASPLDATVFSYTPEVLVANSIVTTKWEIAQYPVLNVMTSDIGKEGLYSFTFKVTSEQVPALTSQPVLTINFIIVLTDNPCIGGIAGTPVNGVWSQTFYAHTIPVMFDFAGINNGQCDFSYELLGLESMLPADSTIFAVAQPLLVSVPGAIDARVKSVLSSGYLTISAVNSQAGTYNLLLRVNSDRNIFDSVFVDVSFTIIIAKYPCLPGIVAPALDPSYEYFIKDPAVPLFIPFNGLSNGDCKFQTVLTNSDGSAIDPLVFSYVSETFTTDSVIDSIFSVASVPSLNINSTDRAKEGLYIFSLSISSLAIPSDNVVVSISLAIQLTYHPCNLTKFQQVVLNKMTFTLGSSIAATQEISNFKDSAAEAAMDPKFCGGRTYQLTQKSKDLKLIELKIPTDIWTQPMVLELQTTNSKMAGQHIGEIEVWLNDYRVPKKFVVAFDITILPQPFNQLPFFSPALNSSATIQMTSEPESWSIKLPSIIDPENQSVSLQADFGTASSFMRLDGTSSANIEDISVNGKINQGLHLIKFKLSDGIDVADVLFTLIVENNLPKPEVIAAYEVKNITEAIQAKETNEVLELPDNCQIEIHAPKASDVIYESGNPAIMNSWGRFMISGAEECVQNAKKLLKVELTSTWNDDRFKATSDWLHYTEKNFNNENELNFVVISCDKIKNSVFRASVEIKASVEGFTAGFTFSVIVTPSNFDKNLHALPPVMKLVKMSELGVALLEFNSPLIVFDEPFDAFILDPDRFLKFEVIKNQKSYFYDEKEYIESGKILSVKVKSFKSRQIEIELELSNPLYVSYDQSNQDKLKVTIINNSTFISAIDFVTTAMHRSTSEVEILRQMSKSQQKASEKVVKTEENAMNPLTVSSLTVNVFLGLSLQYLWGMINTLQFVIFMDKWKVNWPPNATVALSTVREIALGEFIDFNQVGNKLLDFYGLKKLQGVIQTETGRNLKAYQTQSGPRVKRIVVTVLLIAFFLALVVTVIFRNSWVNAKFKRLMLELKEQIFWNGIIRFYIQSFLKYAVNIAMAYYLMITHSENKPSSKKLALISIGALILFVIVPVIMFQTLKRNRTRINRKETQKQIGSLYQGIQSSQWIHLLQVFEFLGFRLMFVLLTFSLQKQPGILVNTFIFFNNINIIYIGWVEPFKERSKNLLELTNSWVLNLICYCMLLLVNLTPGPEYEFGVGWFMIGLVGLIFFINLAFMSFKSVQGTCRYFKLRKLRNEREASLKDKADDQMRMQSEIAFIIKTQIQQKDKLIPVEPVLVEQKIRRLSLDEVQEVINQQMKVKASLSRIEEVNEISMNASRSEMDEDDNEFEVQSVKTEKKVKQKEQNAQTIQLRDTISHLNASASPAVLLAETVGSKEEMKEVKQNGVDSKRQEEIDFWAEYDRQLAEIDARKALDAQERVKPRPPQIKSQSELQQYYPVPIMIFETQFERDRREKNNIELQAKLKQETLTKTPHPSVAILPQFNFETKFMRDRRLLQQQQQSQKK